MNVQGSSSNISTKQQRLALIIGQTDYQILDKSPSAVLDAQLMHQTLQNIGFNTTLIINKTNEELRKEFDDFGEKLKKGDIGFVYYSGHAAQQTIDHRTDNFLFGIDAKEEVREDRQKITKGIALSGKIFYQYLLESCIYLVVLDACRVFPKPDQKIKAFSSSSVNLGYIQSPMTLSMDCLPEDIKLRQYDIVFACQAGYGALEPQQGEVGYLAKALSTALSKPCSWTEALVETIKQVQIATNYQQKPGVSLNVGEKILIQPQVISPPRDGEEEDDDDDDMDIDDDDDAPNITAVLKFRANFERE